MKNENKTNDDNRLVDELTLQKEYVERKAEQGEYGIVFADAFIRGIRDLGYKNPATAIYEMIDNSIQANAQNVEICFGFENPKKSTAKPNQIAVVDDGHGMIPEMIRFSVMWGGTHRENDREGFGRYGYGLPSAVVSLGKRYTVYSKVKGGEWNAITIDLEELAKIAETEQPKVPASRTVKPPTWLNKETGKIDLAKLDSGTVVVLENLDRLQSMTGWVQTRALKSKMAEAIGVTYRHILPQPQIFVGTDKVLIVDPLFLMEAGRFYDENPKMAEKIETKNFEVEASSGKKGMVRVRASLLPPNFQHQDLSKPPKKAGENSRFGIMSDYNGLLICRNGRQIDCIRPPADWRVTLQVYDRNWKVELDFDPELDEFFGVTTSKQQIVIHETMWQRLRAGGVVSVIKDCRKKLFDLRAELEAKFETDTNEAEGPSPAEQALAESKKAIPQKPKPSPEKKKKADDNLQEEAKRRSEKSGRSLEDELKDIEDQTKHNPYKIEIKPLPDGPFYRPESLGAQRKIIINSAHRFFSDVYNAPDTKPQTRFALQVLIGVLADAEINAEGDWEDMYKNSRIDWSTRLDSALKALDPKGQLIDQASAELADAEFKNGEAKTEQEAAVA